MSNLRNSANYVWSTSFVLGKGATGFVYQGVHKKTGDSVAVKSFNHHSHLRPLEVQMREFDVMKVLSHENIVKMVAAEDESLSQKKVIVMELCNGGSLYTILDDPQNSYGLEEEEFLCVLKDLSAGMKYLRDKNITHRDLKPGNIMKYISESGKSVYKLTDFGAAKFLEDDQQFMSLYGTEEYLHPDMYERAVLHHPASKAFRATVDLWSIGVTLYHVATGSLPFRPFGGRQNKDTMHYITTNKASGVISGVQHSANGPIEWSTELPKTCLLSQGLRDLVTILLAGILECNDEKMWTFDQFFSYVTDIISRKVFYVFYMNEGKEISIYMQPSKKLKDLKDQIHAQTKVSPSSQLLLYDKSLFINQINASADASTFPTTTLDQPLLLVHMEKTDVKDLTRLGSLSACFPMFDASTTDTDSSLAKTCCSVAHAVKRLVVKLVRCRDLLLRVPKILIALTLESVTKLCSNSDVIKEKFDDIKHRVELLERCASLASHFLTTVPTEHDCNSELQRINSIVSEKKKAKDQVNKKVKDLRSSISLLEDKIFIARRLQSEWDKALLGCPTLEGCVERADTYVGRMRDSWQVFVRDRTIRSLSAHDYQFHMLERVKVQQTSKKLLSLLQDECLKSCLQASSKLDEWYSGMQATMVQCRCLDGDLASTSDDLKTYSASLHQSESEVYAISERIATVLRSTEVPKPSNMNESSYRSTRDRASMENSKLLSDMKSYNSLMSQIQYLKGEYGDLRETVEENNSIIEDASEECQSGGKYAPILFRKRLTSMFQEARMQNNS